VPTVTTIIEHYGALLTDGPLDTESLTVLVVTGATQAEVAAALHLGESAPAEDAEFPEDAAYQLVDIEGGVLAVETSGYADPSLDSLCELTRGGRRAAVVRDNIQAHLRFGCAENGEIVFDADEYMYVRAEEKARVPESLRELFDSEWVDLDADEEDESDEEEGFNRPFAVGLAMAESFTGLRLTVDDLERVDDSAPRSAPSLAYMDEEE
jgi:hypothetical protein